MYALFDIRNILTIDVHDTLLYEIYLLNNVASRVTFYIEIIWHVFIFCNIMSVYVLLLHFYSNVRTSVSYCEIIKMILFDPLCHAMHDIHAYT